MGMIKFNGASSKDFGVEVETFPNYVAPQKEYEAIHIPGRNGDLLIDSGTYSNVEKRYKVNMVKEPPATEVSGPIANFKSNVSLPLSELKTNINPVQDLHGYSKPWSGGGGKNKYCDIFSQYTRPNDYRIFPITLTPGQTYKLSATLKGTAMSGIVVGMVKDGTQYSTFVGFTQVIASNGSIDEVPSFTIDATFTNPKLVIYANTETAFNSIFANYNVQLEVGNQATAYEPYSNICPISGFSALNVTRTGVNLWDEQWEQGSINSVTGLNEISSLHWRTNYIKISPTTKYYLVSATAENKSLRARFYDENKNYIGYSPKSGSTYTNDSFVSPDNSYYVRFAPFASDIPNHDLSLNYPSTDTEYHAYNGQTATVNFGQTVYGGVADVTNGKVIITHEYCVLNGTETITSNQQGGHTRFSCQKLVNLADNGASNENYCSHFIASSSPIGQNQTDNAIGVYNRGLYWRADQFADATAMKNYLLAQYNANTPIMYVAKLATPTEITTTPENLVTLIGDNNIFSDSGDVYIKTNELATTYSGKMELIANWLNSASGYARLEDSYDPDYYRLAYFNQALDIDNLYDEAGQVTLSFICKPQKFYKSGEESVVFTSAGRIQNRTQHTALPLLKVKTDNTDGTVSIGNSSFGISAGSGTDIIIDCELQNAYYGIENKNNYIILNDGDFPRIEPGTQVVSFTGGVKSVEVIPRWWTV